MTNSEPVIVFIWDNDYQCYYLKNVGKGPAINIIVSYADKLKPTYWINPVKCYSLEPNGKFYIDWGLTDAGKLFIKGSDVKFKTFLSGVPKIGAVYSSANFLRRQTYTSVCENENTVIKNRNTIKQWTNDQIPGYWTLRRRTEENT
jgi:hypothetical protein